MFKALRKKGATADEAKLIDWSTIVVKAPVLKKKMGSKKWEQRFAVLTKTHICWFESEAAFESRSIKGQINLYDVSRTLAAACPPDDKPENPLQKLKPTILHVIMNSEDEKNPTVYLFSEDWKKAVDAQIAALKPLEEAIAATPTLGKRRSTVNLKSGLSASKSAPNLKRSPSSNAGLGRSGSIVKFDAVKAQINYEKCMKSGYVEKRKFEDGYKWEKRYFLLTGGHLVWFLNKEERDAEKPQNAIELTKIKEVKLEPVPGDDTIPQAVWICLEDVTYLFFDSARSSHLQQYWRDNIVFAIQQINPMFGTGGQ